MRSARRRTTTALAAGSTLAVAAALIPTAAASAAPATHHSALSSSKANVAGKGADAAPGANADGSVDVRVPTTRADKQAAQARQARALSRAATQKLRGTLGTQGVLDVDPLTGTPRQVAKVNGFLTGKSKGSRAAIALAYVRRNRAAFGLTASDLANLKLQRHYVDVAGVHHLSWLQTSHGLPLFGNGLKANVAKDGRLISVEGSPVAGLTAPGALHAPSLASSSKAIASARKDLSQKSTAAHKGDVATQVLFRTPGGTRRAWQVITMGASTPSLHVLDAATGRILYKQSLSADANAKKTPVPATTANVFENYPGAPKGGTAKTVDLHQLGYLPKGAFNLFGNNAHTYADINDDNAAGSNEEITNQGAKGFSYSLVRTQAADEPCTQWVCTWQPDTALSWAKNGNAARTAVNNFYLVNKYHDHLAKGPIGFTEAAGNFELINSSGKGKAGDPVIDEPLDGANTADGLPDLNHIDNANMSTPPDGQSPRMQMYLFHAPGYTYAQEPFIASSGSDEADVVYHEYTHGLSNRLVVGPDGVSTLNSQQSGSMGEAWSDWYAMDFLNDEGYEVDTKAAGEVRVGDYVGAGQDLIRTQPLDCPVGTTSPKCAGTPGAGPGGYTYGDFGKIIGAPEVHADGEIWGETLWDLRGKLGSKLTESLVTRAMELSPAAPSYLDMRNSILQADLAIYGGRDVTKIWKTFAHRGMGYFAGATGGADTKPVEDFSMPPSGIPTAKLKGTVRNSITADGVAGATVYFGGHASGFANDIATKTDAYGHYTIKNLYPGTYPDVVAVGGGYLPDVKTVKIVKGTNTADFTVVRDWAESSGGATIADTNDDTGAPFGCGAAAIIDGSRGTGWSANLPTKGTYAVIAMPAAVNVTSLQVDPSATCGDGASASTADYTVETSTDGTTWTAGASGTFTPAQVGTLVTIPLASTTGIKYVRYTMLSSQAAERGYECPSSGASGCAFVDTTEVIVQGTQAP